MYVYIYIYIYREREIYIYVCIYNKCKLESLINVTPCEIHTTLSSLTAI